MTTGRTLLQVSNVTKRFGGLVAVDNVSFDVKEHEVLGLIGPNGSGKTTIMNLVSGATVLDAIGYVVELIHKSDSFLTIEGSFTWPQYFSTPSLR